MAVTAKTETATKRPGGRSARVRSAVLKATIEELAEVGLAELCFESVARRAGVNKTTLYRRWGDREKLILDAMLETGNERVPLPDTGSLAEDLRVFGEEVVATLRTPEVDALVRAAASVADPHAQIADVSRCYWAARMKTETQIVDRAIERGEVPADTDARLALECFLAPIYFRVFVTRERVDALFLQRLAHFTATRLGAKLHPQR
jgi:AcrR family transcriptional regulator